MKTTKVYHAPGYPLDPAREEKRAWRRSFEYKTIPPDPIFVDFMETLHRLFSGYGIERKLD